MDLDLLDLFVTVAEEKSFSKAALRLNRSQPPVTRAIQKLEHELQVKLFERTTRSVLLTEEGKRLYEKAATLKSTIQETLESIRHDIAHRDHELKISGTTLAHFQVIPRFVKEIKAVQPTIVLNILEDAQTPVIDGLLSGDLDLGFVLLPCEHPHLKIIPLESLSMKLAVSKACKLPSEPIIPLSFFSQHAFVMHNRFEDPGMYDEIVHCCERAGFHPKLLEVKRAGSCMAHVNSDRGIHFVVAETNLNDVRYVDVDPAPYLQLGLAYHVGHPNPLFKEETLSRLCSSAGLMGG